MINLLRQSGQMQKSKNKSISTLNKNHTVSMSIKLQQEQTQPQRQQLRNITNRINEQRIFLEESKSRSASKYKRSLMLQDTTIHLIKKNSEALHSYSKKKLNKQSHLETDRASKERTKKNSIDYSAAMRIKTDMTDDKCNEYRRPILTKNNSQAQKEIVQLSYEEFGNILKKLNQLKTQKDCLAKEIKFYRKQFSKNPINNAALKAFK